MKKRSVKSKLGETRCNANQSIARKQGSSRPAASTRRPEVKDTNDRKTGLSLDGHSPEVTTDSSALSDRIVDLFNRNAGTEVFATPDGIGHATVPVGDGPKVQTHRLRSSGFAHYVRRLAYQSKIGGIAETTLKNIIASLESQAIYSDGPKHRVFNRVGTDVDGSIWLDLANDNFEAVNVTSSGWKVVGSPNVRFVRRRGQLSLPTPVGGGSVDLLRPFCNVTDADWPLLLGFIIGMFQPDGPYPVLALFGEQGSSKSTLARVLRSLIDPHQAMVRTPPKDSQDLMISAVNNWLLALDNLSTIPDWLSDSLCRLSTGGAVGKRQLYSDDEEVLLEAMRPCILNGIEEVVHRSDLLDRSLVLELPKIPDGSRQTNETLWIAFTSVLPKVLGAILDALVVGLRKKSLIDLPDRPRLADFATFVTAAESGLGLKNGEFMAAYRRNRSDSNLMAIDSSSIGPTILKLAEYGWKGNASQLLDICRNDDGSRQYGGLPGNPRALSGSLKRLTPNLRALGIEIGFFKKAGGNRERFIEISKPLGICVPPRPTHRNTSKESRDAGDVTGRKNPTKNAATNPRPKRR